VIPSPEFALRCGVCGAIAAPWNVVDGIQFTDCGECECIAMDSENLLRVDGAKFARKYDANYWSDELLAAKERSWGATLARAAEAILLCRRPVVSFLDIGTGPGYLLDALTYYLPTSKERFFGVEKFPPEGRSAHPGFIEGGLEDLRLDVDCGVCMEVIEHLTPQMLRQLARELSWVSKPNALYIFNTGLSDFVRTECPTYIDPLRRGHIVSWGFPALIEIFAAEGFKVNKLGSRDWAFAVEYLPEDDIAIADRVWHPLDENAAMLNDPATGMVMHIVARESLRSA
jgi:hypothetical protein